MELREKTHWHIELNGGGIPLLELPNGRIVKESAVIAEYAEECSSDGLQLYPENPEERAEVGDNQARSSY